MGTTAKTKKMTTYQLAVTALMAAVLCVLGPFSVPVGAVPVSLTNLVIYFTLYLLGAKCSTISVAVYLVLGAVGLPVFSGFSGGLAKLAGPTGGYLIGFLPLALLAGLVVEKTYGRIVPCILGMMVGTAVLYALGTAWFVFSTRCEVVYALTVCVVPFILFDAIKIIVAAVLGRLLRARMIKAGCLRDA